MYQAVIVYDVNIAKDTEMYKAILVYAVHITEGTEICHIKSRLSK